MAGRIPNRGSLAPVSRKEALLTITEPAEATNKADCSLPGDILECAVCLQSCVHPVKLPCSHIFCFLCVKGAANQSRRCALCRHEIPIEFFNNPTLVGNDVDMAHTTKETDLEDELQGKHYSWFYEGRNGWWQYDERTNVDLEENYNAKKRSFELLIAGYMYVIDLDNMVQMRRNDPSRRRRVKRDLVSAPKKGIAGLKIAANHDDGVLGVVDEEQTFEPDKTEAAGGIPQFSRSQNTTSLASGSNQTKPRTTGVGSDVNLDHYDADNDSHEDDDNNDDDDDDDDDNDNNEQWLASYSRPAMQRSRPAQRVSSNHYARINHSNHSTEFEALQNLLPPQSTRPKPRGLPPIRQQRISSVMETQQERPLSNSRSTPSDNVESHPEHVKSNTDVNSAMRSLHLSTSAETVDEVTTVPVQPPQRQIRRRTCNQGKNDDVTL